MGWLGLIAAYAASGAFFLVSLFFLMLSPAIFDAPGSEKRPSAQLFFRAVVLLPLILGGCMIYAGWQAYQGQPSDAIWTLLGGMAASALLLVLGATVY